MKSREIYFGISSKIIGMEGAGVICNNWKYIKCFTPKVCPKCGVIHHQEEELYNLKEDPEEERNLVAWEKEVVRNLKSKVLQHLAARYVKDREH